MIVVLKKKLINEHQGCMRAFIFVFPSVFAFREIFNIGIKNCNMLKARFLRNAVIVLGVIISVSIASSVQAACYLVDTSNDVTRQLTAGDKSAITSAAIANRDITTCDVSGMTDMSNMFLGLKTFNQDIGGWDVSNVTNMQSMFAQAFDFNQDIGGWDVSNVTNMFAMFAVAYAFNQDIGGWDVSNVTNMTVMFGGTQAFNQDIGGWDVSNVTNMESMFSGTQAFNQDIGGWDVSNVTKMWDMFFQAQTFNQDLSGWNVISIVPFNVVPPGFNYGALNWTLPHPWTQPSVTTVNIASNNANNKVAKAGDIVTVAFTASEVITPTVLIDGNAAIVTNTSGKNYTAIYTMQTGDNEGVLALTIDGVDSVGNSITQVTSVTDGSAVTFDKTAPMLAPVSIASNNINNQVAAVGDTVTVTFTASEAITATVLIDGNAATVTSTSSNNFTATYVLQSGDNEGPLTFSINSADTAGNATSVSAVTDSSIASLDSTKPTVSLTGPAGAVAEAFTIAVEFSEPVTGFSADDMTVVNGAKGTFTEVTVGTTYTMVITPVDLGKTVSVTIAANVAQDAAGNGNAAETLEVIYGSPALEFEAKKEVIKNQILGDAKASLQNAMNANANLVRQARERYIASVVSSTDAVTGVTSRNTVPLNYDVAMNADSAKITSRGNFFSQQGSYDGKARQIFFGDFSVVGEKDGSVTGSFSSKIAWEENISGQMMVGYFVGVEVSHTDIYSSFTGKKRGYGLNVGGYFVNEFADNVFIDGFVSAGTGNNILDMSDDVLDLEGIYQTRSGSLGGAITGVYDMNAYEFRPELAVALGKTKTLKANFTGRAYGSVDDNLTLDAGSVTVANLTVRPEVRRDLESEYMSSGYTSQLTMAPRLICEWVATDRLTQDCGSGAELGLMRQSYDGLSQFTGRVTRDYVGNSGRTGLEFKFEKLF